MDNPQLPPRPRTPVPTLWFEFLLDASLLQKHLAQENPEPSATQLLVQFVDQSIKTQGEEESESQKRKAASLKSLALQVAAHLNWNITRLQKELPLFMVHKILKDFVESVSPPNLNIQPTTDVCSLGDSVVMALAVYNRWCIRTLLESVHSPRPNKPAIPALPNGSNLNVAGINDMVIKTVKDTLQESVSFLERCLPINRDIIVPGMQTFSEVPSTTQDTPPTDTPPTNGSTGLDSPSTNHKQDAATEEPFRVLTKEQFLCLLCYDLGSFHFHQRILPRAAEMFNRVARLLPSLSNSVFSDIDSSALQGYLAACGGSQRQWPSPKDIPYGLLLRQLERCRQQNMKGITELLEEDNYRLETLPSYREHLLSTVLSSQPGINSETAFQVLVLHVIRMFKEGMSVLPQHLNVIKRGSDKNLECLAQLIKREVRHQEANWSKMRSLFRCLCSEDRVAKALRHSLKDVAGAVELLTLCQMQKGDTDTPMETSTAPPSDNMALRLGYLEQRLLLSNSQSELERVLTQLHRLGPGKRYSNICSKWQIEKSYAFILDGMGNKKIQDMLFLLLVKAQHCTEIKNYAAAKSLLEMAHGLVRETSFKLQKALLHEILYIELLSGEASAQTVEPGKLTVPQRIQACLSSAKSERDITPRDKILDQCVLHLLNSGNWIDAMAADFIGTPYSMTYQYSKECHSTMTKLILQLGKVLATVCHDLSMCKEPAKSSACLWNATLQIFSSGNKQVKRTSSGKTAATMQREPMLAIMPRSDFLIFLKQLRSSLCLSIMLSLLVRLHNILRDDSANELSHEHTQLWPTTVSNVSVLGVDSVTMVMSQLIRHMITVNPGQSSWLRTQADNHFANNQYAAALQFYLQSASILTGMFEVQVPRDVWTDTVYRRLIKCCSQLQCYTQVALLCQLLQPVDYTTAFKALQEQNCYDASDALYDCFWDVTILEYLIYLHNKRNEQGKKQKAIQALSATELNSSNADPVLTVAAQTRSCRFLRAMVKQYL